MAALVFRLQSNEREEAVRLQCGNADGVKTQFNLPPNYFKFNLATLHVYVASVEVPSGWTFQGNDTAQPYIEFAAAPLLGLVELEGNWWAHSGGVYGTGDLVDVVPDTHVFVEGPPEFLIVRIPGIAQDKFFKYLDKWEDGGWGKRRRLYKFDWFAIPEATRNAFLAKPEIVFGVDFTLAQVKSWLKNKETGLDESGVDWS